MSYEQNSESKLIDAELEISLFRWSRRFIKILGLNYDREAIGMSLYDI